MLLWWLLLLMIMMMIMRHDCHHILETSRSYRLVMIRDEEIHIGNDMDDIMMWTI